LDPEPQTLNTKYKSLYPKPNSLTLNPKYQTLINPLCNSEPVFKTPNPEP